MDKIIKFFIVITGLIFITMVIAWLQAYMINPLLNEPITRPYNCTILINCMADGIIFPRINCQGGYYGAECRFTGWFKKLD